MTGVKKKIREYLDGCDEEGFKWGAPRMAEDIMQIIEQTVPKAKQAFVCDTALGWDLCPENAGHVKIYGSEEAIREDCSCTKNVPGCCGIVEIEVRRVREVQKNRLSELGYGSLTEDEDESTTDV